MWRWENKATEKWIVKSRQHGRNIRQWRPMQHRSSKVVFGSLGELRYSHLNLAQPTIYCLLGRLVSSQHCRSHTKNGSQPGPTAKLKSSFTPRPGWLHTRKTL
jgi:hypothetical protein